jgi:hypothetical protein
MGDVGSLPLSLKDSLKRGVLITAANWHVVVVQFVADALFKTLLAVPIVGGVFLAVLLVGGDPGDLLARPVTEIVPTMASVLLAQPIALSAFLVAIAVVVTGSSTLMFLVKGGTVTVLIAAERAAGAIEHPPLRLTAFRRATQFSMERFTSGSSRLFPRYLTLGVGLMGIYLASTLISIGIVLGPDPVGDWRLVAAAASLALVVWITIVNFVYLLLQISIATDDCTVREAMGHVTRLFRARFRTVTLIFGATLALVMLTTAASILATAALGLIAFVPLVGLAALPLQLVAWLVRGIVFQFIGLMAVVAYLGVYRELREGRSETSAVEIRRIG